VVGARTKVLIHRVDHCLGTLVALSLTLRQQVEMRNLGTHEQVRRTIRASSHARTATDACGGIHRRISHWLGHGYQVGIRCAARRRGDEPAGLDDAVERRAIHHQVFDDRKRTRPPRLNHDRVVALERTHVQLARGGGALRAVRLAVDHQRAGAADAFAAVVVEHHCLFALRDEALVQHIQHLQE